MAIKNSLTDTGLVAILDAGSQYSKIIDKKIREIKVRSEIIPLSTPLEEIKDKYCAIIISGGPGSVYEKDSPRCDERILKSKIPIFGICYGMQLINLYFGGTVERHNIREDGQQYITVDPQSLLFTGLHSQQEVLLTHGDSIGVVAPTFKSIATSDHFIAAIENTDHKIFGVQFHPEVDLTTNGSQMFYNFLIKISNCPANYTIESREEICIAEIRKTVGNKKVLVLVSGGVDSSVCAALLYKALGPQQICALHINNGFMRLNESKLVEESLAHIGLNLRVVDASDKFFNGRTFIKNGEYQYETPKLCELYDPEEKRKVIGDTFMIVAQNALEEYNILADEVFLAQGTLRTDLIESASITLSQHATKVKTHHNDSDLVRILRSRGSTIEPLKDYHKDEVKQLGLELGLPEPLLQRHPFPGPGLAVRIICCDEPLITEVFERTNQLLCDFVREHSTRLLASQQLISSTLLPIKSVGVQGDNRTYSYVAALSCEIPNWPFLFELAKLIPKICHNINRVVFVFREGVKKTINSVTPTTLTPSVVAQLREADAVVTEILYNHKLLTTLSQVPVILVPIDFDEGHQAKPTVKRSVVIRTFITKDFMTGVPAVPGKHLPESSLEEMINKISKQDGISRVLYDLTAKPPGTTEWE
ncbi:GMP synthase [glutamine-hydrolyzing]-like [Zophobas morio]|jgi:GMP synthase (glutamine-hydrolysing)|uniref:GMP synthase [glutamine-hydrolyzing]-like n=1 Tax=Zophobas morio TaxID=2755281 RepID=UPI003083383A